jgi:hypothetical protein
MLQIVTGWTFITILLPVLISIGVAVLSMSPPAFRLARVCFTAAAVILFIGTGCWVESKVGSTKERLAGIFLALVITAVLWVVSIRWIHGRESEVARIRHLSDWQRVKLISSLSRYDNQKVVIVASAGGDTRTYAEDLGNALKGAGWRVRGPLSAPPGIPVVDVQVSVAGKYFGQQPPEAYATLRGTLEFVGIRCRNRLVMDPAVPDDVALVWVGGQGNLMPSNLPPIAVQGMTIPSDF